MASLTSKKKNGWPTTRVCVFTLGCVLCGGHSRLKKYEKEKEDCHRGRAQILATAL